MQQKTKKSTQNLHFFLQNRNAEPHRLASTHRQHNATLEKGDVSNKNVKKLPPNGGNPKTAIKRCGIFL